MRDRDIKRAQRESNPRAPSGLGFQDELRSYLREAKMGVRAQFDYWDTVPQMRQLARVDVPPHLATHWTVTLGPPNRAGEDAASADVLRLHALVTVGVAGQRTVAEVDWRQGGRFEVAGSSVSVQAVLPGVVLVNAHGYPLRVSASIVPGRGSVLPPTRTVWYGDIPAIGSVFAPVPSCARQVFFARQASAAYPWHAAFYRNGGATQLTLQTYHATAYRTYGDVGLSLIVPPEATSLEIVGGGEFAITDFLAIYELAL